MVRVRGLTAMLAAGLLALAAPALARTGSPPLVHSSNSTNWAGYAVHGFGRSFHQVVGTWREPSLTCHRGQRTFSSYWVGLGGYTAHSRALEQTGTEADCTAQGTVSTFAWFELVPAPSVRVRLRVPPGDLIRGTVAVAGRRVHVLLQDLTRHTAFSKVLRTGVLDLSSAEWIVEAPSDCVWDGRCVTLPLADFGSTSFAGAMVRARDGHLGPISDPRWRASEIKLIARGQAYVSSQRGFGLGGQAAPSGLSGQGSAFSVAYSPQNASGMLAGGRLVAGVRLVHSAH